MAALTKPGVPPEARPTASARPWILLISLCFFAVYAGYSLLRHRLVETAAWDLGIFGQAVRSYAETGVPTVPLKGPDFHLLGDHFHPILALLAPFYWLWPSVRMLLVAQAALVAVSILPIGRLAAQRLGTAKGCAVAVAYALSWGVQGLVSFDFHEVAFAVPLLAFALAALAERRWRAAVLWTLPLLAVKEDMGLTVAAVGAVLLLHRQRARGAVLIAAGAAGLLLAVGVVIPALNPSGSYPYWNRVGGDREGLLSLVLNLPAGFVEHPEKLTLLLSLGALTAFAALRSPLLLVIAPTLLYRFVSADEHYWSTGAVHYNAILMPVVFAALLDALPRWQESPRPLFRRYARAVVPATLLYALLSFPLYSIWSTATHLDSDRVRTRAAAAHRVLPLVPDGVRIAASNHLAPQLVDRCEVILFPDYHGRSYDWILLDTTRMTGPGRIPPSDQQETAFRQLEAQGFTLVKEDHGISLYRR